MNLLSLRSAFQKGVPDSPATFTPALSPAAPGRPWGPVRLLAFRFTFAYLVLYLGTTRLGLGSLYERLSHAFVPWVGKHVLRLPYDVSTAISGSGDTTYDYVNTLCQASFAAAVALAWSAWGRRSTSHPRLNDALRVCMRYSLALAMFSYGMAKVVPMQFSTPGLFELTRTYGESSPMGLLWTFMGYSRGYQVFTGGAEVLGGVLLLAQSTTTLGALVVVGVMANVVMLNFCYDVPVKLYSTHLLVIAGLLLAPDLGRVVRFFVRNRPAEALALRPPPRAPWARRARVALKVAFLAYAAWGVVDMARWAARGRDDLAGGEGRELRGIYDVEYFARGGAPLPPADGARFRTAVINDDRALGVSFRKNEGEAQSFFVRLDGAAGTFALLSQDVHPDSGGAPVAVLRYGRPDEGVLTLEGDFEGAPLSLRLRRLPEPKSVLMTRGFHWVNETPYGR